MIARRAGVIAVESQTVMLNIPADPGAPDSAERLVPQAGQVPTNLIYPLLHSCEDVTGCTAAALGLAADEQAESGPLIAHS